MSKHRVGRESIVRAETDALKRAHAALEPPKRLRFEDGFADDEGNPNEEMPTTIAEADGATTMAIESKFGSREGMEQVIEMGMEQGMQGMVEALGQIDALLAGEGA